MPNAQKKSIPVVVGNYTFFFSDYKLIVVSKERSNKSEEELRVISKAYEEYKHVMKPRGRPMEGEWKWCMNPECNNAFYIPRSKIESGRGSYCTHRCGAKVFGFKKKEKIA